jgi:hypothetical protein
VGTKLEIPENPILAPFKHMIVSIKLFSCSKYERDCLNAPYRIGESKALSFFVFVFVFVSLV